MSKEYRPLTEAERYHIYTMKKQGYSNNIIAQGMGRNPSTIGRELRRNVGKRGYRHQQANGMAKLPLGNLLQALLYHLRPCRRPGSRPLPTFPVGNEPTYRENEGI